MNRPTGVTIIAILQWIGGILSIIGGVLLLAVAPLFGIVALILGLAAIVIGVGLWKLQSWAWIATLVLQAIDVIWTVINVITGNQSLGGALLGLIISIIIIVYLLRPEIKAAFGQ